MLNNFSELVNGGVEIQTQSDTKVHMVIMGGHSLVRTTTVTYNQRTVQLVCLLANIRAWNLYICSKSSVSSIRTYRLYGSRNLDLN